MRCAIALVLLSAGTLWGATAREESFAAANGLTITVKTVVPGKEPSPMQVICYLKHKPGGDNVTEALVEFDRKMGGIVQALRDRDEFWGNEMETLFFLTPKDSLKAHSLLLIGLGDQANLSLETMSRAGTVALRETGRSCADS